MQPADMAIPICHPQIINIRTEARMRVSNSWSCHSTNDATLRYCCRLLIVALIFLFFQLTAMALLMRRAISNALQRESSLTAPAACSSHLPALWHTTELSSWWEELGKKARQNRCCGCGSTGICTRTSFYGVRLCVDELRQKKATDFASADIGGWPRRQQR